MNGDVSFQNVHNCVTMAAGTDPQPIESSVVPAVCGKPTSNSLTRISSVRNSIPYLDHNYGKPLTPPDSCSPEHPEEADTGNEDEGFTRCICGFKHDDGYMICCDKCSAWQHVECVGIKSNCVPETYLCDMCEPRPLDKKRAIQIQTKKSEEPTDEEDDEDSDHDSDTTTSRTVSLPNSTTTKEIVLTKGKRKKRESTRKLNQKEMKHNKRKRRKRKHVSTDTIPVDEETNGPWNIPSLSDLKRYEEAHKTVYIGDLENRSFPLVESNAIVNNSLNREQICKVVDVQKNKKGVVVTEDIDGEQFIIECKGTLMMESKFKEDHPMFSKCDPFVLYYTKLELVMNFSAYGNDARFIRRSCSPTAEVRHVTVDNKPHLIVTSITPLAKGTEVTLAFEFSFEEYRRQLDCACAQDNCKVLKHNMAIQRVEQTNGYRCSKDEHGLVDSSLSNHMDSDSDNDSNATKDKRSKRKLSREDRKLQQYLRQFEKMEKTQKKKQQSNGRDARANMITPRNYPEECNGETPTKPCKALRKQGLSQRQQRKIQAVRRAHRLPSCSSEPLSPEDNYSSNASTPTTPLVNVIEENHELPQQNHQQDTPEKSFKFPNKTGSLNDIASASMDISRSDNASPETTSDYHSPSKPSFEARLQVEVEEPSCDRLNNLHVTINGGSSPRTDPNCSPSPCHSTYASPTHSESVDPAEMFTRHPLPSPSGSSVASFILTSGLYKSNHTHTTLKKRWLLQYANERPVDKVPNGVTTTNVFKPNQITRVAVFPKTFPLPYKRRKLMEYQKTKANLARTSQLAPVNKTLQATTTSLTQDAPTVSSTVKTSYSISSPMTPSVTSSLTAVGVSSLNQVTSHSTSNNRPSMLGSSRTVTSGVLKLTGSDDTVTGSEEASWGRRISGGSDDTSVGRSSLSSISSTDDLKMDAIAGDSAKAELNLGNTVGSSSEANRKPPLSTTTSSQVVQENSLESSTDCVTRGSEDTSRDKTVLVGSSGVAEGTVVSTTSTTPGGKKKVSLMEYLNRKRTTGSALKKEATPGSSSDVTSASQSRVSDAGSLLASSEPVSPVVKYRRSLGTSVSGVTSGYSGTLLSTGVSSSTGGVMIEPVSPDEGYRVDDDRPVLHNAVQGLRNLSTVEREAKPSTAYRNSSQNHLPLSEPGSSSDAMDIDDDDVPSSSTILVNTPVTSLPSARPAAVTSSDMMSSMPAKSYSNLGQPMKFNNIMSSQPLPGRQIPNSVVPPDSLGRPVLVPVSQIPNASISALNASRPPDFRPISSRPSPFY